MVGIFLQTSPCLCARLIFPDDHNFGFSGWIFIQIIFQLQFSESRSGTSFVGPSESLAKNLQHLGRKKMAYRIKKTSEKIDAQGCISMDCCCHHRCLNLQSTRDRWGWGRRGRWLFQWLPANQVLELELGSLRCLLEQHNRELLGRMVLLRNIVHQTAGFGYTSQKEHTGREN